jgi:hypothetical protein
VLLRRHCSATLGATTAGVYAFLHVAQPLTVVGALVTYLGTFPTNMLVMLGADQHEMCRGSANLGASRDQAKVPRFCVLAAYPKAVLHRCAQANLVAVQALIDTGFHFRGDLVHRRLLHPMLFLPSRHLLDFFLLRLDNLLCHRA